MTTIRMNMIKNLGRMIITGSLLSTSLLSYATAYHPVDNQAPWQKNAAIKANKTSPVYKQEWQKSKYKSCPILAIPTNSLIHPKTVKSRAANFSGGFAVAYDVGNYQGKPLKSAYGVANVGKTKVDAISSWPAHRQYFADGSFLTSGHEANNPKNKMLAYLVLKNGCFYNVWSQLGDDFLQQIISELRYVK